MPDSKIRLILLSAGVMLAIPALSAGLPPVHVQMPPASVSAAQSDSSARCYRVLRTASGTVEDIPVREYLIGVVGAEMPAAYEPEALKAQAVAAHTYAERIRAQNAAHPDPALHGADFSDDSAQYQAFYSQAQMQQFYGGAFEESCEKIAAAVDAVSDALLYYENEPIAAAFHAISAGQTESAGNVWGTPLPYLVSVSSEGDRSAPEYETVRCISPEKLKEALREIDPAVTFSGEPESWLGAPEITGSGTVLKLTCGSAVFTGQQIREALGLRSACFTVRCDDKQFIFTVRGFGHAVGMSQYGANVMAKNGSSCDEILLHYYPGAEIVRTGGA